MITSVCKPPVSKFIEGPLNDVEKTDFRRIIIRGAKNTWDRRGRQNKANEKALKKGKPAKHLRRIPDDDIKLYQQLAKYTGMNWAYDPLTDDIMFETKEKGEDVELDGFDTGGQLVRSVLSMGLFARCPSNFHLVLEIHNELKATALALQSAWWVIPVDSSISINGGNFVNNQALHISKHPELFQVLKEFLGVNFEMEDMSETGLNVVRVFRKTDVNPVKNTIAVDEYKVDQILMGLCMLAYKSRKLDTSQELPFGKKVIKTPATGGYHIPAMLKLAKSLGIPVSTNQPEFVGTEELPAWKQRKAWVDSKAEWEITIN